MSLISHSRSFNGRIANAYEYHGETFYVYDSVKTAILIEELFADKEITESMKQIMLPCMVFAEPEKAAELTGDDFWYCLDDIMWKAYSIDLLQTRKQVTAEKVIDLHQDAARIKASFLQAYQMTWDMVLNELSYQDFIGLVGALVESGETPLQQAIYYRLAKPPKRTKYNAEEVKAFEARRAYFKLKSTGDTHDRMETQAAAMASAFAAETRASKRK